MRDHGMTDAQAALTEALAKVADFDLPQRFDDAELAAAILAALSPGWRLVGPEWETFTAEDGGVSIRRKATKRCTPEERVVIEAAEAWRDHRYVFSFLPEDGPLVAAIDRMREGRKPRREFVEGTCYPAAHALGHYCPGCGRD
jgi:hypothetical protein